MTGEAYAKYILANLNKETFKSLPKAELIATYKALVRVGKYSRKICAEESIKSAGAALDLLGFTALGLLDTRETGLFQSTVEDYLLVQDSALSYRVCSASRREEFASYMARPDLLEFERVTFVAEAELPGTLSMGNSVPLTTKDLFQAFRNSFVKEVL